MKRFFSSLRFRLILLVLLAVIPAMVITFINGQNQRRLARINAEADALRLARVVAGYQNTLLEGSRQLTAALSLSKWDPEQDVEGCRAVLVDLNRRFPMYSSLNVVDTGGTVLCSSATVEKTKTFAGVDYFEEALRSDSFVIGIASPGPITGRMILPMASPIRGSNGETVGLIQAGINLQTVVDLARTIDLPPGSALLILETDGHVLVRYPSSEEWAGRSMPDAPVVSAVLERSGEGQVEEKGLDGVKRLYAYTPIQVNDDYRLTVSVGIPTSVIYATADRMIVSNLIWISIIAAIAIAVAWFIGDALFLKVVSLTAERDAAEERLRGLNQILEERVEERTEELDRANYNLNIELEERKRAMQKLNEREAELEKMLAMLEQSNRELENFAYITSHDLQEPLRKIQAFGDRLTRNFTAELGEEGNDYIQRMRSAANRMQVMVNDLLAYSRVTSRASAFVPVDLNRIAAEVIEDLEVRIGDSQGKVLVDPLPVIVADNSQIRQLLQNLITNGLKFHRKDVPPVVKVTCEDMVSSTNGKPHEEIILVVEDNGIGFDEKYLDRIFLPFQRLHSHDVFEGSGIGLAICRKIVERHGGTITAKSTLGSGSRFIIRLPRYPVNVEGEPHEQQS